MKLRNLFTSAGVLAASLTYLAGAGLAQGPLYDKIIVDLPYKVTVNDTVLDPGHYVIRQFQSQAQSSRILQIYTDGGMKLKTTVQTIPALDNNTPDSTKVILHHYGSDYYFDKIWVVGKNYGYEFPLPPAVKSRQRERLEPYTIAATYEAAPAQTAVASSTDTTAATTQTQTAEATPAPAPAAAPAVDNTPAPAPAVMADNSASANANSGMNARRAPRPRMPHTADNWFALVLIGALTTLFGLLLRRREV